MLSNLKESSDQLVDQIEINYNNRVVTREIGQIINRQTSLEGVLAEVAKVLEHRLDFDRGMIMLTNKDKTRLRFEAGFGYSDALVNILQNFPRTEKRFFLLQNRII